MNAKRIISFLMAVILSAGMVSAQAAEITTPGGTALTDVTLGTDISVPVPPDIPEPEIFSAAVPAEIPIYMDSDGVITVADNLFVENRSSKAIRVTGIQVKGKNGWKAADFNDDLSAKEIGTKEISLSFRGDTTTDGGDVGVTPDKWVIEKGEKINIEEEVRLPRQVQSSKSSIATVVWTLDWADAGEAPDTPVPPTSPVTNLTAEYENGLMLPGSTNFATFRWTSTDRDTALASVVSASPEIADVSPVAAMAIYRDETTVGIVAKSRGTAVFTGTTSSGDSVSFTVQVSEMDSTRELVTNVRNSDSLKAGDKISPEDIGVLVPVINPDGSKGDYTLHPDTTPDEELEEGSNSFDIVVDANGVPIEVTINVSTPSSNPSNGLKLSIQEAQDMGFTFMVYEDGLAIKRFENKQFRSTINVPEQIGDFKVLKINSEVFMDQTNLKHVTLPDTIRTIENKAFSDCTNLISVNLPKALTTMGRAVFHNCVSLDCDMVFYNNIEIVGYNGLPASTVIYASPFTNCKGGGLNLIFKKGVTSIPRNLLVTTKYNEYDVAYDGSNDYQAKFGTITFESWPIPRHKDRYDPGQFTDLVADKIVIKDQESQVVPGFVFYRCSVPVIEIPVVNEIEMSAFGHMYNGDPLIKDLYYGGTKKQWPSSSKIAYDNDSLNGATGHFSDNTTGTYSGRTNTFS